MKFIPSKRFEKNVAKLSSQLRAILAECLRIFAKEPQHPLLNNHALHGKRVHLRSINISGDYRLIYEKVGSDVVRLMDIDTHSNLYGG